MVSKTRRRQRIRQTKKLINGIEEHHEEVVKKVVLPKDIISNIPDDITAQILNFLTIREVERDIRLLNKYWKSIVDSPKIASFRRTIIFNVVYISASVKYDITKLSIDDIIRICTKYNNLTVLGIQSCKITDKHIVKLSYFWKNLEELHIYGNIFTDIACIALSVRCKKLKKLSMQSLGITDVGIIELINNCDKITLLACDKTSITDETLKVIASKCKDILTIQLAHCINITNEGVIELAKCTALQRVHLNDTNITPIAIIELVKNCPNLTDIET